MRLRWVALFTALFLAISAVPVLAEAPPSQPPEGPERLPNAEDIARGFEELEEQEAAELSELETPAAEQEREESQDAFEDVSAAQAENLLQAIFAEQLALIDQDPARALSEAELERVLTPTSARIEVEGETLLMEGSMPVRAPAEEEGLEKVSLDLEQTAGEFTPANPLTEVTLPEQISEGIEVGESGLEVTPVVPEGESAARPMGEMDLLYFEAAKDLDLLAQPIAGGVELSAQLRSAESPEQLRLALELPAGASLGSDGRGGAEVTREGDRIATVSAPRASDAQGAEVPVTLEVEGDTVVMDIPHRGGEFAYPILLDPAIGEDWYSTGNHWYGGANLSALDTPNIWVWTTNASTRFVSGTSTLNHNFGGSGRGLFASAKSTTGEQAANTFGQWSYTVPNVTGTTWITAAGASPFWRYDHSCSAASYPEPHDYAGLWSLQWSPQYSWITFAKNNARNLEHTYHTPPAGWKEKTSEVFILGMGTGSSKSPKIPCWRDLYAGGIYVWLDDTEPPSLGPISGAPASEWVNNSASISLGVQASDNGLGVQNVKLNNSGGGDALLEPIQDQCSGLKADPCPSNRSGQISVTTTLFSEGERPASVIAIDPIGKVSSKYEWKMKVDNTAPTIDLDGQLAEATQEDEGEEADPKDWEELRLPVYDLHIDAVDGSAAKPEDKRSGVKSIAIYLDEEEDPEEEWTQSCPASSCSMSEEFTLPLTGLSAGRHVLHVVAEDQIGNSRDREIEFEYFPATGMKDEYVMHYFPLPDGLGDEEAEEFPARPEIAVNVMNGNLVYRERDIDVEGYAVDLEVERYYNSQLPEEQGSEWGDGWTLAQTPELELEESEGPPEEAEMLAADGALDGAVELPTANGEERFNRDLQALVTKDGARYELSDETGQDYTSTVFDGAGKVTEERTEGYAKVEYDYEDGALSEIAVEDPASTGLPPLEEEEGVEAPTYSSAFGSNGSGNGQLKAPADVAVDSQGNLWVADKGNNRIQKLNPQGEYLAQFGTPGSGNGQLSSPSALAIDADGHLWVADAGNSRIQEFSSSGEYLGKFGVSGLGAGQLFLPEGIAIGTDGTIWVSDGLFNSKRVQRFTPGGEFIERVGTYGSGSGQLGQPKGIDVDPDGNAWVADWQNNRVSVFDEAGDFLFQFGSQGSGEGQFSKPAEVEINGEGNVWIGDQGNDRVQLFDSEGGYLAQFGAAGSGKGQLDLTNPLGIASDESGRLWVTDPGNNRIQEWSVIADHDPAVDVEVAGGLVSSVDGEAAGEHSYEHEGDLLTSHEGPNGETQYEYDSEGRLSRVELANGTWAEIAYEATSRVESVEVDPAGSDPATEATFAYDDANRRTTVVAPPTPTVHYEYAEDGSVFKWNNVLNPPTIDNISGSFYEFKETPEEISAGDYNLSVTGHSFEGIKSVEILANGSELIDEATCDSETPEVDCQSVPLGWTTYTGNLEPGRLDLEVIVVDYLGQEASERFWVNIPRTPPDVPGGVVEPHFPETLQFREEHGFDLDLEGDEEAIEDRVNLSLYNWANGDPVARASMERWGAPLFPKDVAELEWRLRYWEQASQALPAWVGANASSTFAGYYLDERAGGKIVVGFTGSQAAATLAALEQSGELIAEPDRIVAPIEAPEHTLASLESLQSEISASEGYPAGLIQRVRVDIPSNVVEVGASDVSQAESLLQSSFGAQAPITVFDDPFGLEIMNPRQRIHGVMRAGDEIYTHQYDSIYFGECTASFGAFERGRKKGTGQYERRMFVLTAAHCVEPDSIAYRWDGKGNNEGIYQGIGVVKRSGYATISDAAIDTDVGAIYLKKTAKITPRRIYLEDGLPLVDVTSVRTPAVGTNLCFSGRTSKERRCGPMFTSFEKKNYTEERKGLFGREACFRQFIWHGDSGSPVWVEGTGAAVGVAVRGSNDPDEPGFRQVLENKIITRLIDEHGQYTVEQLDAEMKNAEQRLFKERETCFVPLKLPPDSPGDGTAFGDPLLAPLHLVTRNNAKR